MRAIFCAIAPEIRRNITVPGFENVNMYPLMAKILGRHNSNGRRSKSVDAQSAQSLKR